ncbi:hypothetical protein ABPG72_021863 [Tetrahymena utriculariae]
MGEVNNSEVEVNKVSTFDEKKLGQNISSNVSSDLGILTIFDSNEIPKNSDGTISEQTLLERTRLNISRIFNKMLSMKTLQNAERDAKDEELQIHDFSKGAYELKLPNKVTVFPRQKPIPKEKPLTRWQKFAKEKGIEKKRRGRMVWDDNVQDWVPRWGAYSVKKNEDKFTPIMEHKAGTDPYEDPFLRKSLEKRLTKEKQKMNEIRNKLEAKGYDANKVMKNSDKEDKKAASKKKLKGDKKLLQKQLQVAQNSTRSMGTYDKKAHKDEVKMKPKVRRQNVEFDNRKDEKKRDLDILDFIQKGEGSKKLKKN